MSGMDLADFLLARIAEDEASAREITNPINFTTYGPHKVVVSDDGLAAVAAHPARILAESEAKRRIVEQVRDPGWATYAVRDFVLGQLALPYADHDDYRQEWRP